MPLFTEEKINEEASWALWHIREEEEELLNALRPNREELTELARLKTSTRRLEWLASRLVLQSLTQKLNAPGIKLVKDEFGKPRLQGSDAQISISHAFPYAAAILHQRQTVGIDIEKPREQLVRIRHKFLNAGEQEYAGSDTRKLCVYWAAKEAIYKLYGKRQLIFQEQILIQPFNLAPEGQLTGELIINQEKQSYSLHYRYIGELLVCYCL